MTARVLHNGRVNIVPGMVEYYGESSGICMVNSQKISIGPYYTNLSDNGDKSFSANPNRQMYGAAIAIAAMGDTGDNQDTPEPGDVIWDCNYLLNSVAQTAVSEMDAQIYWAPLIGGFAGPGSSKLAFFRDFVGNGNSVMGIVFVSGAHPYSTYVDYDSQYSVNTTVGSSYETVANGMVIEFLVGRGVLPTSAMSGGTTLFTLNTSGYNRVRCVYKATDGTTVTGGSATATAQAVLGVSLRPANNVVVPNQGRQL